MTHGSLLGSILILWITDLAIFTVLWSTSGGLKTDEPVPGHDAEAEKSAMAGRECSERVLRKEDMQVYVLRLLLEYARISDDNRDMLGFVGDLNATDWHR
jgi:hypothetical protein